MREEQFNFNYEYNFKRLKIDPIGYYLLGAQSCRFKLLNHLRCEYKSTSHARTINIVQKEKEIVYTNPKEKEIPLSTNTVIYKNHRTPPDPSKVLKQIT